MGNQNSGPKVRNEIYTRLSPEVTELRRRLGLRIQQLRNGVMTPERRAIIDALRAAIGPLKQAETLLEMATAPKAELPKDQA